MTIDVCQIAVDSLKAAMHLQPPAVLGTPLNMPGTDSRWSFAPSLLLLQDAVRGDHGEVVSLLLQHGGKVMNRENHLIDLADSHLSGNVRIFGEIDPEWEVDPKKIVFQEKVRAAAHTFGLCAAASSAASSAEADTQTLLLLLLPLADVTWSLGMSFASDTVTADTHPLMLLPHLCLLLLPLL